MIIATAPEREGLHEQIVRIVEKLEGQYKTCAPEDLYTIRDASGIIILDTADDVAALNQIVYYLTENSQDVRNLLLIAFLSSHAIDNNPKINGWVINGRAALAALIVLTGNCIDTKQEIMLQEYIRRLMPF